MCNPYWSQWDKEELDSLQGIEREDVDREMKVDERVDGCSCGSHCMDCLGMSWKDFM